MVRLIIEMKTTAALLLCVSSFLFTGCYYDIQEELHPSATGQLCDTTAVTYAVQITNILQTNCVGCHSASSPSGNIALDTYNGVKTVAENGRLVGSIDHLSGYRPMPQNQTQLSECDRLTVKKWIENGSSNN
jgi:uncharacterized membrane protein